MHGRAKDMDCKDIDKLITAYLEGVASHEEREQVQDHLASCSRCREELEIRQTSRNRLGQALKLTASRTTPPAGSWESIAEQAGIKGRDEKPVSRKSGMSWLAVPLSIFLLAILVGGLLGSMGGTALPPPKAPAIVSDGNGGAFLFWQDTPDNYSDGIYAQHVAADGALLWGEANKQLDSEGSAPLAVSDGTGGAIVAWGDGNGIYIERLDSQGYDVWENGKALVWLKPTGGWQSLVGMVPDGSGGAILLRDTHGNKVYAQRVSAGGALFWVDEGVLVGDIQAAYRGMPIASDGSGGAVFVWEDSSGEGMQVLAQRINQIGEMVWGEGGVSITSIISEKERPKLINDGTGGFIVAWTDITSATGFDENVYVQKLDSDGSRLWGDTGILIYDNPEMQSDLQLTGDGSGGCVIAWKDTRRTSNSGIFAQRISAAGEPLWQDGGVPLRDIPEDSPRPAIGDIYITGDDAGNSIVIWEAGDFKDGTQIYAQKLGADGKRLWQDAAVEVAENPPFRAVGYGSVISDSAGGFIIISRVSEDVYVSNSDSVYAQRVDSEGNRWWGENGLLIQVKRSSPVLPITAAVAILVTILVLFGVFRGSRLARIFTAILPILIGITALFSHFLLAGMLGYSYAWAYIPKTPVNLLAASIIPIAGLVIGVVGIWKRTVPRWAMIPIVVFSALITVLLELIVFAAYF